MMSLPSEVSVVRLTVLRQTVCDVVDVQLLLVELLLHGRIHGPGNDLDAAIGPVLHRIPKTHTPINID